MFEDIVHFKTFALSIFHQISTSLACSIYTVYGDIRTSISSLLCSYVCIYFPKGESIGWFPTVSSVETCLLLFPVN